MTQGQNPRVIVGKDLVEIDMKKVTRISAVKNNQANAMVAFLNSKALRGKGAAFSSISDVP